MSGGFTPALVKQFDGVSAEASFLASEQMMVKRSGITVDASTVAADEAGNKVLKAGQFMSQITATGKYGPYPGKTNENQTATVTGSPTGGSYLLSFGGFTTGAIAYNATAAAVQAALEALPNVEVGDVAVTGNAGGPYSLTFAGNFAGQDVPALVLGTNSLTGGTTPSVTIATPTAGGGAVTDGRQTPSDDTSGYLLEGINLKQGDVICGLLIRGSVLSARVTPTPDATTKAAVKGRIQYQ
jgi:hypothetical protein